MPTFIVTVSGRGQVVIPREVRRCLQIVPGKKLLVKVEGDSAVMTPLPDDPVAHFCGIFKEGSSLTEELLAARKREHDNEDRKIT